jgi:hypothetical protein
MKDSAKKNKEYYKYLIMKCLSQKKERIKRAIPFQIDFSTP